MHVPSCVGFDALKSVAPLLVAVPVAKLTLYESPLLSASSTQPSTPGLGGTSATDPSLPEIVTLIRNTPSLLFSCTLATGPFSPFGSAYLNPFCGSPLQNGLDVRGLVAAGRLKTW